MAAPEIESKVVAHCRHLARVDNSRRGILRRLAVSTPTPYLEQDFAPHELQSLLALGDPLLEPFLPVPRLTLRGTERCGVIQEDRPVLAEIGDVLLVIERHSHPHVNLRV